MLGVVLRDDLLFDNCHTYFCNTILYWYLQVKGGLEGFPMMLVGNKCDEEAGKQLDWKCKTAIFYFRQAGSVRKDGRGPSGDKHNNIENNANPKLQRMWKCKYIETSAKQGTNINELFEELLKMETKKMLSLQPIEDTEKKKKKCCLM